MPVPKTAIPPLPIRTYSPGPTSAPPVDNLYSPINNMSNNRFPSMDTKQLVSEMVHAEPSPHLPSSRSNESHPFSPTETSPYPNNLPPLPVSPTVSKSSIMEQSKQQGAFTGRADYFPRRPSAAGGVPMSARSVSNSSSVTSAMRSPVTSSHDSTLSSRQTADSDKLHRKFGSQSTVATSPDSTSRHLRVSEDASHPPKSIAERMSTFVELEESFAKIMSSHQNKSPPADIPFSGENLRKNSIPTVTQPLPKDATTVDASSTVRITLMGQDLQESSDQYVTLKNKKGVSNTVELNMPSPPIPRQIPLSPRSRPTGAGARRSKYDATAAREEDIRRRQLVIRTCQETGECRILQPDELQKLLKEEVIMANNIALDEVNNSDDEKRIVQSQSKALQVLKQRRQKNTTLNLQIEELNAELTEMKNSRGQVLHLLEDIFKQVISVTNSSPMEPAEFSFAALLDAINELVDLSLQKKGQIVDLNNSTLSSVANRSGDRNELAKMFTTFPIGPAGKVEPKTAVPPPEQTLEKQESVRNRPTPPRLALAVPGQDPRHSTASTNSSLSPRTPHAAQMLRDMWHMHRDQQNARVTGRNNTLSFISHDDDGASDLSFDVAAQYAAAGGEDAEVLTAMLVQQNRYSAELLRSPMVMRTMTFPVEENHLQDVQTEFDDDYYEDDDYYAVEDYDEHYGAEDYAEDYHYEEDEQGSVARSSYDPLAGYM